MTAPEPRCERSDLPTSMCAHCRPTDPITAVLGGEQLTTADVVMAARFEARFPGRCENCDGPIRVGDVIAPLRDGAGYACTECLP